MFGMIAGKRNAKRRRELGRKGRDHRRAAGPMPLLQGSYAGMDVALSRQNLHALRTAPFPAPFHLLAALSVGSERDRRREDHYAARDGRCDHIVRHGSSRGRQLRLYRRWRSPHLGNDRCLGRNGRPQNRPGQGQKADLSRCRRSQNVPRKDDLRIGLDGAGRDRPADGKVKIRRQFAATRITLLGIATLSDQISTALALGIGGGT